MLIVHLHRLTPFLRVLETWISSATQLSAANICFSTFERFTFKWKWKCLRLPVAKINIRVETRILLNNFQCKFCGTWKSQWRDTRFSAQLYNENDLKKARKVEILWIKRICLLNHKPRLCVFVCWRTIQIDFYELQHVEENKAGIKWNFHWGGKFYFLISKRINS